jgi:WD40 repeat protein
MNKSKDFLLLFFSQVFDLGSGRPVGWVGEGQEVLGVCVYEAPDMPPRLAVACEDCVVRVYDGASLSLLHSMDAPAHKVVVMTSYLSMHSDGPRVVARGGDGTLFVYDGMTGEIMRRVTGLGYGVTAMTSFACGDRAIVAWGQGPGQVTTPTISPMLYSQTCRIIPLV